MAIIETAKSTGSTNQKTVSTSAVQMTSADKPAKIGVRVKNTHASNDLYVGFSSSVTTGNGFKLATDEEIHIPISNANKIWLIASASGTVAVWMAI